MSSIEYNANSSGLVDEWMSGVTESADKPKKSGTIVNNGDQVAKTGLGFKASQKKDSNRNGGGGLSDMISKSVKMQKKKYNSSSSSKHQTNNDDNFLSTSEQELSSRLDIVRKSPAAPSKESKPEEGQPNKKQKSSKEPAPIKLAHEGSNQPAPAVRNPKKGNNNGNSNNADASTGGKPERTRKRTKTRSKQKNIKRDKRAESDRPEHIQNLTTYYGADAVIRYDV